MARKKMSNLDLRVGVPLQLAPKCTMVYKCGEIAGQERGNTVWILLTILERSLIV